MTTQAELDALARQDLHMFIGMVFRTLHPRTPFLDNWSLEAISWQLEQVRRGNVTRLIINVPPRSLKSEITSVAFPAFLLGRDPSTKILCISHSNSLAWKFSRDFRRVVESDWYRRLFPKTVFTKSSEEVLETSAGGARRATSIEAGVTGHGGSIILIDDPLDAKDAQSAAAREKVIKVYRESLFSRLDNKVTGQIVLVMQRLHVDDLSGFLGRLGGFKELVLPAVAPVDAEIELWEGRVHQRQAGNLLHPAHEPQSALDEQRALMSASMYAAQYQQAPVPDSGDILKGDWIKRHSSRLNLTGMRIVMSWDTAIKGIPEADYSVCTVWGERAGDHFLLEVYRKKVNLPQLVSDAAELYKKYPTDMVLIEDQGSGSCLIDYLRVQHGIRAVGRRPREDKATRFAHASLYFEKGQVAFPEDAPWLSDLERELFQFPSSAHDDQVDSISQYLNWSHEHANNGFSYDWPTADQVWYPQSLSDVLGSLPRF